MKVRRFINKCLIKLKRYWLSKIKQDELEEEIYDSVLLYKYNSIKEQLLNTDKDFLVELILSEKIIEDSDIHFYYEVLQNHKEELNKVLVK